MVLPKDLDLTFPDPFHLSENQGLWKVNHGENNPMSNWDDKKY
jgi:hypothetical protein